MGSVDVKHHVYLQLFGETGKRGANVTESKSLCTGQQRILLCYRLILF